MIDICDIWQVHLYSISLWHFLLLLLLMKHQLLFFSFEMIIFPEFWLSLLVFLSAKTFVKWVGDWSIINENLDLLIRLWGVTLSNCWFVLGPNLNLFSATQAKVKVRSWPCLKEHQQTTDRLEEWQQDEKHKHPERERERKKELCCGWRKEFSLFFYQNSKNSPCGNFN